MPIMYYKEVGRKTMEEEITDLKRRLVKYEREENEILKPEDSDDSLKKLVYIIWLGKQPLIGAIERLTDLLEELEYLIRDKLSWSEKYKERIAKEIAWARKLCKE